MNKQEKFLKIFFVLKFVNFKKFCYLRAYVIFKGVTSLFRLFLN